MSRLRCTPAAGLGAPAIACDYHRDGGPATDKCLGVCDAPGCTADVEGHDEDDDGRLLCAAHRARPGALEVAR